MAIAAKAIASDALRFEADIRGSRGKGKGGVLREPLPEANANSTALAAARSLGSSRKRNILIPMVNDKAGPFAAGPAPRRDPNPGSCERRTIAPPRQKE